MQYIDVNNTELEQMILCARDEYICRTIKRKGLLSLNTYYRFRCGALKRTEVIVASAVLMLVAYTFALSVVGQVFSSFQESKTISNVGAVKAIGVGVYQDYECTSPLPPIDWGMLEPGSNKDVTCYIRNEGNSASNLSMYTSNWNPSSASDYISLSWDYGGQSINPSEVVQVTFTLSISASIEGITSFSFDITIVGSG